jgi:CHAD domain-containing protein
MRELELKLAVDETFAAPDFPPEKTDVERVEELPPLKLSATYYDTPDLRLARHGVTLRHRTGGTDDGPWTVKVPARGDAATREELSFAGSNRTVPGEALDLVTAFTRRAPVEPVARLRTQRRHWSLLTGDGAELAELTDDRVAVLQRGRIVERFRELEIEARADDRAALESIAKVLRKAGASPPEPTPKVVRALGRRALEPPDFGARDGPSPGRPAAHAVRAAIGCGLERMVLNDPGARLGDPEAVRQMRVGARRLNSNLSTFASLLDREPVKKLREELRWLMGVLGDVRDLDVIASRLQAGASGPDSELQPLFTLVARRRSRAHARLLDALRSDRYVTLVEALVDANASPPLGRAASRPARTVLTPLVASRSRKLTRDVRSLDNDASPEDLHRVRIRAKRLRHAAEAAAPGLGRKARKRAKKVARGAAAVQDILGEMHDAVVASDLVRQAASRRPGNARFKSAAEQVVEQQEADARRARARFVGVLERVDRKKLWKWPKS